MSALFYVSECLSTQDEIETFLLQNNLDSAGLYTFRQTKGKGQYGNSWENGENLNIAYSTAVKSADINCPEILFNFHTANIVRSFVANLTQKEVLVKWPNDLIIAGKKISGMLTEKKKINDTEFYIFGVGINVLQEYFSTLAKAGSIMTQTGQKFDLHTITEVLHECLQENLRTEITSEEIMREYNENLFRKDTVSVFNLNKSRQNGIIREVSGDGKILIELENDGLRTFNLKEIELLY